MAAPFKDHRTGIYYFRRIVPGALRTHFDGGRTEYKRSLETRDPNEAKDRYPAQAVIYDLKLKSARRAVLNDHIAGARNMVDAFLSGVDDQQLRGHASKLASLEIEAFAYAHGTAGYLAGARYDFGAPPSKPDLGDHADRKRMLEAVPDLQPLPWQETLLRVAALPSLHPIAWAITAIAYNASVEAPPGSELYEAIGQAYLDRLCVACVVTIPPSRMRIVPPTNIVGSAPTDARLSEPEGRSPTTRPGLAITAVFELWATFTPREPKLVDEWRTAIGRFAALHNDPPVTIITPAMVRDYRRTYSGLPSRPKQRVAVLPLRDQVDIARAEGLPTLSPETVNKALSAVPVVLNHAVEELELIESNVAKSVESVKKGSTEDTRLPFEPDDMKKIFKAPLPERSGVSAQTIFWTLLLAAFTGCRLDEIGKLRPANVRTYDDIPYIAIEFDRQVVREAQNGPKKRVKTASAKRDIPVHSILIQAGFLDMVTRRRAEGAEWLFPELVANKYGSRTQRLSRVINDFLNAIGLSDPELVFYSFRHTGKRAIRGKVISEVVDLLFGHADGSVSTRYGRGAEMVVLRDSIEKIAYPFIDWDEVTGKCASFD